MLLHYLFVSQTAHLLALFGVFLDVGVKLGVSARAAGVPAAVRDELFLGDHAAGIEREPAVRGSGYLSQRDLYRLGALTTAFNLAVYLAIGLPWLLLVGR